MRQILVIGGTGFIGGRAVSRLAEQGHAVLVVHRGETRAAVPPTVDVAHAP